MWRAVSMAIARDRIDGSPRPTAIGAANTVLRRSQRLRAAATTVALALAMCVCAFAFAPARVAAAVDRFDVVRRTGNTYTITKNFMPYLTDSLQRSGEWFTLRNGTAQTPETTIRFLGLPQRVNASTSLPAALQLMPLVAASTFTNSTPTPYRTRDFASAIVAHAYALSDAADVPFWRYFGLLHGTVYGAEETFECNATLPGTQLSFSCAATNASVPWRATFTGPADAGAGPGSGQSRLDVWDSAGAAHDNELLGIALSIDQCYQSLLSDVTVVADDNTTRHDKARVAVGFLWFFGVFTLWWAIWCAALWQSWCGPYFECCGRCSDVMNISTAMLLWCLAMMIGTVGLSWGFGLAGMIFCAIAAMLWGLSEMVVYTCCARCCRNKEVTREMLVEVMDEHEIEMGAGVGGRALSTDGKPLDPPLQRQPSKLPDANTTAVVPTPTPVSPSAAKSPRYRPMRRRDQIGLDVPTETVGAGPGPTGADGTTDGTAIAPAAGSAPGGPVADQKEGVPSAAANPNVASFLQAAPLAVDTTSASKADGAPTTPAISGNGNDNSSPAAAAAAAVAGAKMSVAPNGSSTGTNKRTVASGTVIRPSVARRLLPRWNKRPFPCGVLQRNLLCSFSAFLVLSFVAAVLTFVIFQVNDYQLWARIPAQNGSQTRVVEYIPSTLAKGIQAAYNFATMATKMKMNNLFFTVSTEFCGPQYSKQLTSDDAKRKALLDAYITPYGIDMSIYNPPDYLLYNTVNEWFSRPLQNGTRPIAYPLDDTIIVSPCDARVNVFPTVPADSKIWLKDQEFTVSKLLGYEYDKFTNGAMAIIRLAPQDYHRFHSPVPGRVVSITRLSGGLQSVNADGMRSNNDAIYNQRTVVTLETARFGRVAYVPIGATCVGSVLITPPVDTALAKGDELGMFQFGGSTVVVMFESGRVQFDEDLLFHSSRGVESLMNMGQSIGTYVL